MLHGCLASPLVMSVAQRVGVLFNHQGGGFEGPEWSPVKTQCAMLPGICKPERCTAPCGRTTRLRYHFSTGSFLGVVLCFAMIFSGMSPRRYGNRKTLVVCACSCWRNPYHCATGELQASFSQGCHAMLQCCSVSVHVVVAPPPVECFIFQAARFMWPAACAGRIPTGDDSERGCSHLRAARICKGAEH
jgi:hypothetical protein